MNKLFFRSRDNAMRYVVVQQMTHCLFAESQPSLDCFVDDCLTACKCLLKKDLWSFEEVSSIALEVWSSIGVE